MAQAEVEVLLADLEAQAEAEREGVREQARRQVAEILGRADVEVRRLEEEARLRVEREIALDRERIHGRHLIQERRRRLDVRRAGIAKAFARARELLATRLQAGDYHAVLGHLAREAIEAVGADADLEVARADAAAGREILASLGARGAVRERGEERGTVAAVSPDGLRRADNSALTRLAAAERVLEEAVAGELFGGGGSR